MMHAAFSKLGSLPDETLVYVGHEYTVSNLQYASFVEPGNAHVKEKLQWAETQRAKGAFTIPSTISDERRINPFLRAVVGEQSVLTHCKCSDTVDALRFVREEKSGGDWKAKLNKL
jgi:hydroxyacylglutathione hydrolase